MSHAGPGGTAGVVVWALARLLVRVFYRVERTGGDVPDGPVLLVANHANGLLDPVVVVVASRRRPRFLAKSTLFDLPVVGWFVRQAGAIPVYRRSDAGADAARNEEMFRAVSAALAEGNVVCLFPEGISHSSGRLEPLRTGAARIALRAAAAGVPVRIVPVGLNFEDKEVFRSTVLVAFGPPITCDGRIGSDDTERTAAVRALTDEIARHLRDVMVEAEPTSETAIVERVERLYSAARSLDRSATAILERRRLIARGLHTLRERDPERFAALYEALRRYERRRERFGLREDALLQRVPVSAAVAFALRETAWGMLLGPVVALGVAAFFVPYQAVRVLSRCFPVSLDQQATFKIATGIVCYLSWLLALVAVAWRLAGPARGAAAALALPALGVATLVAQEREGAVLDVVRGYVASRLTGGRVEGRLLRQRAALADLLDETYRWLQAA